MNNTTRFIQTIEDIFVMNRPEDIKPIPMECESDIKLVVCSMLTEGIRHNGTPSTKERVKTEFKSITDFIDSPFNIQTVEIIDILSSKLSVFLENGRAKFSNEVIPTVDDIIEDTTNIWGTILKGKKLDDLIDTKVTEDDYKFLKWGNLRSNSRCTSVLRAVEGIIKKEDITFSHKFRPNVEDNLRRPGHTTLKLEDKGVSIAEELLLTFNTDHDSMSQGRVENFVRFLTDNGHYGIWCKDSLELLSRGNDLPEGCMFMINQTEDFDILAKRVGKVIDKLLTLDEATHLKRNLGYIQDTIYLIQYRLITLRENEYKDALILSGEYINNEVYEKFIASGKDIRFIHSYLKLYNSTIPRTGVKLETVVSSNVEEKLDAHVASVKVSNGYVKTSTLHEAFMEAVNSFLHKGNFEEADKIHFRSHASKIADTFHGSVDNISEPLTLLYLKSFYREDFIYQLYKDLGGNISTMMLDVEGTVTDEDILETELSTYCETLSKYLLEIIK